MLYQLKPINYTNKDGTLMCISPTHEYTIRYDHRELKYTITFYNLHSKTTDIRYEESIEDCKYWIEQTHIPAKLQEWFNVIESTQPNI